MPEALDACQNGLKYDSTNSALKSLLSRVEKRRDHLAELERVRTEREERSAREQTTLSLALKNRGIRSRSTMVDTPNLNDAAVALADPSDEKSTLNVPVILLYPLHAQSDFVKAFAEHESVGQHLEYILPLPWDEEGEYTVQNVECYMETVQGGLIKAGKNLSLGKLLGSGKVEIINGLMTVDVVPKAKSAQWIADYKLRRGKS